MSHYRFTSDETLVFRDGRPFGDAGAVRGGFLFWPLPSTLTGMIRSHAGLVQAYNFFTNSSNRSAIFEVGLENIWPCCRVLGEEDWNWLHPSPADALLLQSGSDKVQVVQATYGSLSGKGGTDYPEKDWLFPRWRLHGERPKNKPLPPPKFWHWPKFEAYLQKNYRPPSCNLSELGAPGPTADCRVHSAIDSATQMARDGALFLSQGVRLASKTDDKILEYGFALSVSGLEKIGTKHNLKGWAHLGGERKMGQLQTCEESFPNVPTVANEQYLRLILLTPGIFGGWKPENLTVGQFTTPPGCPTPVKLVGACLQPWQPVSGWDYVIRSDKPMRKMVPAGAVYLIELQDPAQSQAVAAYFWGRSLCDTLSAREGFGLVTVGAATFHPLTLPNL